MMSANVSTAGSESVSTSPQCSLPDIKVQFFSYRNAAVFPTARRTMTQWSNVSRK